MSPPLTRLTLKEQAYQALREMIISHRFSAGRWINVEKLSKELGVSRTPVWQALKDLEQQGLVNHLPNRGIRMAEMTPTMAADLYQVREGLEALAAGLAVANDAQGCARRLRASLEKQLPLVESCDLLGYSRLDFDFHSVIYDACGNGLLRELLDNIKYRSGPLVCDISPILADLYDDHQQLVEAFGRVEAERASEIMRRHNQRMRQCLQTYFGESLGLPPAPGGNGGGRKKTLKRAS